MLTHRKSKKDKKAGKLLCNWKFETRKPNYLKSCLPLYCSESDLPTIPNAQLEVSHFLFLLKVRAMNSVTSKVLSKMHC